MVNNTNNNRNMNTIPGTIASAQTRFPSHPSQLQPTLDGNAAPAPAPKRISRVKRPTVPAPQAAPALIKPNAPAA